MASHVYPLALKKFIDRVFLKKNEHEIHINMTKMLRSWAKATLNHIKASLTVHNPKNFKFESGKKYLIMSNHASHFDIPIVFYSFEENVRMIAKKELFSVPCLGFVMKAIECVSIDRENTAQAMKDLDVAKERMESGIVLWIAPEGTRSKTGELQTFKRGGFLLAMKTGAIILPVSIRGSRELLPSGTSDFGYNKHVDAVIGEPVDTTQYSEEKIKDLMADVRGQIEKLLIMPLGD
jgi:1-acyl-sn-glycerol-3-phosphate acyltransferase